MASALDKTWLARLQNLLGDRLVFSPDRLQTAAKDETHGLEPKLPQALAEPLSADEVRQIVLLCAQFHVPITPRGAGTGKSGGCVPLQGGLVVDFSRMNRIVSIDAANLIVKVEPGVILADLQAAVDALGLFYPPDPASLKWCTLGGNIAENAGGPCALKYGVTRDYVLGLEAVLPTGELVRLGKETVKGVTGYDLCALLCGSEGTLALITQATLKLLPKPKALCTALLVFASERDAAEAVSAILSGGILPRSIEYLDRTSVAALRAFGAPYRFPLDVGAALVLETDAESEASAFASLQAAVQLTERHGLIEALVAQDDKKRREIWETRRLLSEAIKRLAKRKVSEDIVVPRTRIPDLIEGLRALGQMHGLQTCVFGHAGDGNLHAQVLFDSDEDLPRVDALLRELFAQTLAMGGTLTGEHGVGVAKKPFLAMEQSEAVMALEWRIKKAFDPQGILNPGKFLPPL